MKKAAGENSRYVTIFKQKINTCSHNALVNIVRHPRLNVRNVNHRLMGMAVGNAKEREEMPDIVCNAAPTERHALNQSFAAASATAALAPFSSSAR